MPPDSPHRRLCSLVGAAIAFWAVTLCSKWHVQRRFANDKALRPPVGGLSSGVTQR